MKNELKTVSMQLPAERLLVQLEAYARSEEATHVSILRYNHQL